MPKLITLWTRPALLGKDARFFLVMGFTLVTFLLLLPVPNARDPVWGDDVFDVVEKRRSLLEA